MPRSPLPSRPPTQPLVAPSQVMHAAVPSLRRGLRLALACALGVGAGSGCVQEVEPGGPPATLPSAPPAVAGEPVAAGAAPTDAPPPAALTPEETALLAADPATLTPEQRRERAYALRKKVMADPNSPARALLLDAQERAQRGELPELPPGFGQGDREPVGGPGLKLQLPGTPPPGEGAPPLGATAGDATP